MRIFSNKRGLQQADWVISMGIFVVYLVVFFISIKPLITPPSKIDSLLSGLETEFTDNTTVIVERVPIFIREETDFAYEPIIVELPYAWNSSNMAVSEGYFIFDSGRLMFFANTSKSLEYSVSHSTDVHEPVSELSLISDANEADVSDFKVEFTDGMPARYTYKGQYRIRSMDVSVDGAPYERTNIYEDSVSIAAYKAYGNINHSTYVFAESPRTYSYLQAADNNRHNFTISMSLYNYTEYYAGPSEQGDIIYVTERCEDLETSMLDLSDGQTGLAFFFNNDTFVQICSNETTLTMTISEEIAETDEMSYSVFLHRGDHTDTGDYPVEPVLGFKQRVSSTSFAAIVNLGVMNYTDLKAKWYFPQQNDFQITLVSANYNETIGPEPPLVNIYAKPLRLYNYDGIDFTEANIVLTVWGGS